MFENRLKWFVIAMTAMALLIITRLVDVQIVRAGQYEALADRMLTRPVTYLAAPRGSILDRDGRVLVSDEPTSDVCLRYEVLPILLSDEIPGTSRKYITAVARELRKRGDFPADMLIRDITPRLLARLDALWARLPELIGSSRAELEQQARAIRWRVEQIKAVVQANSETIRGIAEEQQYHALIEDVDEERALALRIELEEQHPWLRVVPGSRRVAHDADALVHVLGRVGAASPGRIEVDELRDDELRGLRSGDRCGITGAERLGELTLRGTRGYVIEELDRSELKRVNPVRGSDLTLTVDADLQRDILEMLKTAVDATLKTEEPAGGAAAAVIDVSTREILALVSYPVYGYDEYQRDYARLVRDNRWQPTRFRAVANMYPPGSTCKVVALYGALASGVTTTSELIDCRGHFRPDQPNRFRCWINTQYGLSHGPQNAEDAVRNSCNIFFYTIGDRLGVDGLCKWFSTFGLGRTQGTGLIEETGGIVPTSDWIQVNRTNDPHVRPSDAWNFSIGQGEVSATPLQCANVAATVASGRWEPVRLVRGLVGEAEPDADAASPRLDERYLRVLRTGMWRVVNERGGTANRYAPLDSNAYEMCGKTGSAQASRRVINKRYVLKWPDGRTEQVIATSMQAALGKYPDPKPEVVSDRANELFPPGGDGARLPSHAWFIGYTQSVETPRGGAPRGRSYAISVIVEYGSSGGRVAGPVAKEIAELLTAR